MLAFLFSFVVPESLLVPLGVGFGSKVVVCGDAGVQTNERLTFPLCNTFAGERCLSGRHLRACYKRTAVLLFFTHEANP